MTSRRLRILVPGAFFIFGAWLASIGVVCIGDGYGPRLPILLPSSPLGLVCDGRVAVLMTPVLWGVLAWLALGRPRACLAAMVAHSLAMIPILLDSGGWSEWTQVRVGFAVVNYAIGAGGLWATFGWRRRKARPGCVKCGYDLAGLPVGACCPECGRSDSAARGDSPRIPLSQGP